MTSHARLAARPRSTRRAIACAREHSLAMAHFSTMANISTGNRVVTAGSCPVAGLPRPRLFLCTDIDFAMRYVYIKCMTKTTESTKVKLRTKKVGIQIPFYRIEHGRGYWCPNSRMRALGFSHVPCGKDGPDAWKIAHEWNERWQTRRRPARMADPQMKRPGFIYFLRSGDRIKIGFTKSPAQRFRKLQTGLARRPDLLVFIAGSFADEHDMHLRLAEHWTEGEWFAASADVLQVMMRSIAFGKPMFDFPDGRHPGPTRIGDLV
jgi:T5orf172 domain